MLKKMAFFLAALLVAAFATPVLAEDVSADTEEELEWLYGDDAPVDPEGLMSDEELAIPGAENQALDAFPEETESDIWAGAMEVYAWLAMASLDVDESQPDSSGTMWRVLDERFNTQEKMLNILHFYFSDEIVDTLWNSELNPYREIDGYLYTAGEGRAMDGRIGETEVTVTVQSETRIELDVRVYYTEADDQGAQEETFHYVRELVGDEWRYTEFPFFW